MMADSTHLQMRATYWRDLKVATVCKVPAARALERDLRRRRVSAQPTVWKQRTLAHLFWRPAHPWHEDSL